mmetsp:Transcript_45788/g.139097  ORF Transcript_45788/g.139097 Transcript_45788/m.139097 type:complete len:135 (+) Transcript_45788:107-511(+)
MPLEEIDANAEASSALCDRLIEKAASERQQENEDEILVVGYRDRDDDNNEFDVIVGLLENTLCDESFQRLQENFCREHCGETTISATFLSMRNVTRLFTQRCSHPNTKRFAKMPSRKAKKTSFATWKYSQNTPI